MVGLENDNFIHGHGWNRQVAMAEDKKNVTFDKGDVLIFRGDFIYGDFGYAVQNTRMYFSLDLSQGARKGH